MKPIKAQDLLDFDKNLEVVVLQCYPIPEQVIYQAAKCDYSEIPIHNQDIPNPGKCGEWVVERLLANDKGHYGCYSSDTEVLTEGGWMYWDKVTEETVLAAYDTKTGLVNFECPSAVQHWDYTGKMYHLEGQALDFLVSPDHRMIVQSRKKDGSWTERYAITAEDVLNKPVRYSTSGNLSENERIVVDTPIDNASFWALIGFWIGDGETYTSKNTLSFHLKEKRKIEYLQNLCEELDLDFYPTENDRYVVSYPNIGYWMQSNCLYGQLGTYSKRLPTGCLKLERDCVYNLLDGLRNSDDTTRRNTWSYSTTSYELASQLQGIAALNNLKFTCVKEVRSNEHLTNIYYLRLTERIYPRVETSQSTRSRAYIEEWVDYEGQIHCATVSTGALIVRRNDKVAVCGNCLEHPGITFSVSGYVHNVAMQARTHRVGVSFDVQSQRYTGRRVIRVAEGILKPEDVFYVRPPGFYVNRYGKKYDWTQEDYEDELAWILEGCKRYAVKYEKGMCEEHIRDYLAQAIRQNFVVSFNLRSVLHIMDLRAKFDAQLEIQALCEQITPHLQKWAPNVWKYYEEKRLHKARLSP
jgi:thymidylate synthase (FAD)